MPTDEDRASSGAARREKAREQVPDIEPVIAEIRALGVVSASAIARELTRREVPTPRGSMQWTTTQVQRVLAVLA